VGAQIDEDCLSAQDGFHRLCLKLEMRPLDTILAGGEDYALLFSLPPRVLPPATLKCRRIGRLDASSEICLMAQSQAVPLPAAGWDHFGPAAGLN